MCAGESLPLSYCYLRQQPYSNFAHITVEINPSGKCSHLKLLREFVSKRINIKCNGLLQPAKCGEHKTMLTMWYCEDVYHRLLPEHVVSGIPNTQNPRSKMSGLKPSSLEN